VVRIVLALIFGMSVGGHVVAAEGAVELDYFKAKEILSEVDGFKLSPNGKLSIAAPTVLAYSAEGSLLHVSDMKELSDGGVLQERLTERARESKYVRLSALSLDVNGTGLADAGSSERLVFVMMFPPQARVLCEPCKTARARLEQVLLEAGIQAKVVEVDLVFNPANQSIR